VFHKVRTFLQEIILELDSILTGETTYNTDLIDVTLRFWGGLLGCSWHYIPTGPLLCVCSIPIICIPFRNNIDGCAVAKNCPFGPGHVQIRQAIDLRPYSGIIDKLGGGVNWEQVRFQLCSLLPYRLSIS
jgi:hypothetical protein